MRVKYNYPQVYDGEWLEVANHNEHRVQCCDCGLVHSIKYRVIKGRIHFRTKLNMRATAAVRRKKK